MTNSAAERINEENGFVQQSLAIIGKLSVSHKSYLVTTIPYTKSIFIDGTCCMEDHLVCSVYKNVGSDDFPINVEECLIISAPWILRLFAIPIIKKFWIQKEIPE